MTGRYSKGKDFVGPQSRLHHQDDPEEGCGNAQKGELPDMLSSAHLSTPG
jgi:hypothetical protein